MIVPPPAKSQVLYGSVVGTVEDPTGAVVPGAKVTMTNTSTGLMREVHADDQGRYTVVSLPAGTYEMVVTASGFRTLARTGIEVTINNVTRVVAQLEVGQVTEQVTVSASAAALQTDRADTRAEISSRTVVELPLPAYRNFQSMINLVPGATPAAFQNSMGASPQRSLTTNVNGTNRNNNNTRVDGAINVYIWLPHHTLYNPPVESIETVNISTSSFDAEQGMAGGAAVTVATKSGTNTLHGSGYWYHDNQHLYARPYFYQQATPKPQLPKSIVNIPGGTIGGPVVKNKLFYFFSFERTWERTGQFANSSTPPADVRAGDFSAYSGLGNIYDPLTGDANGAGRVPFANNQIPASRFSPTWTKIQQLAPLPNQPAQDAFGLTGNYFSSATLGLTRDQYDIKTNYNVNTQLMIWGKYSQMNAPVTGAGALGELTGPALGQLGKADVRVIIPSAGFNLTLSPTFLIDGVFGHTRFKNDATGPDYGRNWGSEIWGIPGTNGANVFAGDIRYSGQPCIANGFTSWGNCSASNPNFYNDRSYTYTTNFSKIERAHELRWGVDIVRHEMNHWQPEIANPRGNLSPTGNAVVLQGQVARSIHTYAAGLLDILGSANKSVQFFDMKTREWQLGFYFRDRWQVTRNFTVNLGARYELYPMMNRGDGRGIERWDPVTNLVTLGGVGNVPTDNGMSVSKKLIAPRLGIAWRLNNDTVLRSGYGITFNPMVLSRPLRGLYPSTIAASWVAPTQFGYFGTLTQGIPDVPTPDISSGIIELPATVNMGPRSPWGGQLNRGYIQSWNFTIERKLPAEFIVSAGYVGNQTVRQFLDLDINAATYIGGGPSSRPLAATLNRLIETLMWDGWGNANYHSLQVSLNKNFSHGLFMKGAYTWSKAINMADDDGWQAMPLTNMPDALHRNRAVAGYDRPHMLVMSWVYELPWGQGRSLPLSGILDTVAGGWRVNGIYSAYSGTPFNVTASTASLNTPGSNTQTADQVGEIVKIGDVGPGTQYYDVTAFRDPNFQRPAGTFRFGSMGRHALRGPGFQKVDLALFKDFRLTERFTLQFKAEAFNFTNTPRFGNPAANVSNMTVNASTGAITNVNNFMAITSASDERKFRFGLRLSF
ncbi:MAG TPA: carboxypeptidase regulatory-like domain-containing protein [Bryobacteraceae bacterium]|nr:carboxypeptidase regulatory-like domain-containing protein [Bryobacteraceae bacterium]